MSRRSRGFSRKAGKDEEVPVLWGKVLAKKSLRGVQSTDSVKPKKPLLELMS